MELIAKSKLIDGQQLSFEFNDEISGICFSKFDRIKLSLIRSDDSKYFEYLQTLRDELMLKYNNFHGPISQQQYTKINIDLDLSKVFVKGSKYLLNNIAMKEPFESHRKVSGIIKFYLYKHDDKLLLIANVETLFLGEEI